MDQTTEDMLYKRADLSSDPQWPPKSQAQQCVLDLVLGNKDERVPWTPRPASEAQPVSHERLSQKIR